MNILDLREFYKTPLGSILQSEIKKLIPNHHSNTDQSVRSLFFGYPMPYMDPSNLAELTFLPSHMGGLRWPDEHSKTVLVDEEMLPLPDACVDRIVVIHGFEYCHNPAMFLAECHRILTRDGKLLIITPNRRSLWAHRDCTPLGHGQPYTMTQLTRRLNECGFTPTVCKRGLYTPPRNSDITISCSSLFENIGPMIAPKFSGIIAIEAEKGTNAIPVGRSLKMPLLNMRKQAFNVSNGRVFIDPMT